jgi:hypothetical protein
VSLERITETMLSQIAQGEAFYVPMDQRSRVTSRKTARIEIARTELKAFVFLE